jgi:AFG3 family protein
LVKNYLAKGYVEKIQIVNQATCRVHLNQSAPQGEPKVLHITMGNMEMFEAKMEMMQYELGIMPLDQVPVQYISEVDWTAEVFKVMPYILLIGGFVYLSRGMAQGMPGMGGGGGPGGRNMFTIGKAFPNGKPDAKSTTKFADVAGQRQAKREVTEFVDFLRDPSQFEALGAKIPKGGLLVGPPGTGKTLLAKAVAGEAGVPFYSMSGSDFVEMFVGVGPSRVRDLFKQARDSAPSIIFIDEIDAVGKKRGNSAMGNDERENTLNQMLVEMDGFATSSGVVVLAGTNRADTLDPALTRPGRFDRQIAVERPDLQDREEIFMVHLKPVKLHESLSMENVSKRMAALTPGFSGADIANICNEAAIFAARRDADSAEMKDFERACERVIGGMVKNNNLMGQKQRRTVALHESGHALVGWFLEGGDPLLKVSIVPRSNGALGFAQYLPEELALHAKEVILDKMAVTLGGRAAEELFTDTVTTGASDDLDKVTKMAYSMVSVYGMNSEIGLVSYRENQGNDFYKPYSDDTGRKIDREARALINQQYDVAKALLWEKRDLVHALTEKLFEKETLVYKDLHEVLGDRPFGINSNYKEFVTASGESDQWQNGEGAVGDTVGEAEKRSLEELAGSGAQLATKDKAAAA